MTLQTIRDHLDAAVAQAEDASDIMRQVARGDASTEVEVAPGVTVPSLAKWYAGLQEQLGDVPAIPGRLDALEQFENDARDQSDPGKGAAILGRSVISVASISELLQQQRRQDTQYLVRGYYAGSDLGGGRFVWVPSSTSADNFGTILAVPGVATGRFARVMDGDYVHTQQFGIDHTGAASAVDRLQAMINLDLPIWVDDGTLLIDKTLFYKNTTLHGPGVLNIVCDSSFTVIPDSFMTSEAAITARAPIAAGPTYVVDMRCKITFTNSDSSKPHTPIRFVGLRDSSFDMDVTCTGSGTVTQTNLPDWYFDNRRVSIRGRYVVNQRDIANAGGMWVRDVALAGADSATRYSENVVVESETYVFNDGVDEALSLFNPSGGTMKNCGVLAADLDGGGLGLSILEFGSASRDQSLMDCFAIGTKVNVNSLRPSQAAVKFDKTASRVIGVVVTLKGFRDTATAGQFYAGFRNSSVRSNPEYPSLIGCKVLMSATADPASEVRAYDGSLDMTQCENAKLPGAIDFEYAVRNNSGVVLGGVFQSGTTFTFDACSSVLDPRPASVTYNSVSFRRGIGRYGSATVTPDGAGEVTVTHNFGVNPVYADGNLENTNTRDVVLVSRTSTQLRFRIIDRATGAPVTTGSFALVWKAEA